MRGRGDRVAHRAAGDGAAPATARGELWRSEGAVLVHLRNGSVRLRRNRRRAAWRATVMLAMAAFAPAFFADEPLFMALFAGLPAVGVVLYGREALGRNDFCLPRGGRRAFANAAVSEGQNSDEDTTYEVALVEHSGARQWIYSARSREPAEALAEELRRLVRAEDEG